MAHLHLPALQAEVRKLSDSACMMRASTQPDIHRAAMTLPRSSTYFRATPRPGQSLTRPRYSPVRVSTRTLVPASRKRGTWIWYPVSTVAGFVPPVARSPCRPGSV